MQDFTHSVVSGISMGLFDRAGINKKVFLFLLAAGILGCIAVLPYVWSLDLIPEEKLPAPKSVLVLAQIVQSVVMLSVAVFAGLYIAKKVGLGAPYLEDWLTGESVHDGLKSVLITSVVLGMLAGGFIFFLDRVVFALYIEPVTASQAQPALWQRFLVSFYGGICEELFMRLFLMSLFVWLFSKIKRTINGHATDLGVWSAIILVSVIFGLGHLPMTARFIGITPLVVVRAIVLNGIAGIVFGWLYWKKGLESAIVSHFSTDIIIHVVLSSLAA